jgi:hypothetical protein
VWFLGGSHPPLAIPVNRRYVFSVKAARFRAVKNREKACPSIAAAGSKLKFRGRPTRAYAQGRTDDGTASHITNEAALDAGRMLDARMKALGRMDVRFGREREMPQ